MNQDVQRRVEVWRRGLDDGVDYAVVDACQEFAEGLMDFDALKAFVADFEFVDARPAHEAWHDAEDDYPQPGTRQELTWATQLGLLDDTQYAQLLA